MQTLSVSRAVLLAPPKAPQAPNGILDTRKLQGVFLLDFDYTGKAAGQRVYIFLAVKPDRFSPPEVWTADFTTQTSGDEQQRLTTDMFNYQFKGGSVEITYTARITGEDRPSEPLMLRIVDTADA